MHSLKFNLLVVFCFGFVFSVQSQTVKHSYASDKPMPQPILFGQGIISTAEDDLNAAFSPDGKTVYFTRNFPRNRLGVILFSEYKNKWTSPQIASFSGLATDYDPFFSPDGTKIFYCSNRSENGKAKGDFDIWYVEKISDGGWSAPKSVGAPVNSPVDEFYPSVASNGTLYFSSNRQGGKGGFDIYRSRFVDGKFSEPENLGEGVNTSTVELDNYISPDQTFMVFAAVGRKDDLGGGDLYISMNQNGTWTTARNLGAPINSSAREYCPIGSPDGKYFFFTSFRGNLDAPLDTPITNYQNLLSLFKHPLNGRGNIYQIDISALGINK